MKILWLVNLPLPKAAKAMGWKQMNAGGWLSGQLDLLADASLSMVVCHVTPLVSTLQSVTVDGVRYLFLPAKTDALKRDFVQLLEREQPDVIHIFGTEYTHSEAMLEACGGVRCVVSLQGVMTEYAKHYKDGLPSGKFKHVSPIKKLVKRFYYADSIADGERDFFARGRCEAEMLKKVQHVIGRTHWDKACAQQLCPQAAYHSVNENLRAEFYDSSMWQADLCRRHSIFISQALYPIKGFHQVLKTLPQLLSIYPDLHLYVGGVKPYTLNNKLLDVGVDYFCEYQHYLKKLMRQLHVTKAVTYTGPLDAAQMKAQYLACNVFVSPSSIENSPNSVGEAMLLGVPVVASDVGGVSSMLTDEADGLLYDFFDPDALAAQVRRIFDEDAFAQRCGASAHAHAQRTHHRERNTQALLSVYSSIAGEKSKREE
ncbi:MAG: glycosyltransferase family 4 protein [Ruthenibacterium sp.]